MGTKEYGVAGTSFFTHSTGGDVPTNFILQVLMSIQSMILVDKPYYNEPGA